MCKLRRIIHKLNIKPFIQCVSLDRDKINKSKIHSCIKSILGVDIFIYAVNLLKIHTKDAF